MGGRSWTGCSTSWIRLGPPRRRSTRPARAVIKLLPGECRWRPPVSRDSTRSCCSGGFPAAAFHGATSRPWRLNGPRVQGSSAEDQAISFRRPTQRLRLARHRPGGLLRLGHRAGRHQLRLHHAGRTCGADHVPARCPTGPVPGSGALHAGPPGGTRQGAALIRMWNGLIDPPEKRALRSPWSDGTRKLVRFQHGRATVSHATGRWPASRTLSPHSARTRKGRTIPEGGLTLSTVSTFRPVAAPGAIGTATSQQPDPVPA